MLRILFACLVWLVFGLVAGKAIWDRPPHVIASVQTIDRPHIPCHAEPRTLLLLGQSNGANSLGHRFRSERIVNSYRGKCHVAVDPLLGASGAAGSLAIPLAQSLGFNTVEAMGLGGTTAENWLSEPLIRHFYESRITTVKPDLIVWIQGESDRKTDDYESKLTRLMRRIQSDFPGVPVGIVGASYCQGNPSARTVAIQKRVAERLGLIWLGNMDRFTSFEDRYDNCHLSRLGIEKTVAMISKQLRSRADLVSSH